MTRPLLDIRGLRVSFPGAGGVVESVTGVDLAIHAGESIGLVGESGSGKSLTAMSVLRLIQPPGRVCGGTIEFDGVDLLSLPERAMRRVRGRDISMVFQDPSSALNPAFTIGQQLVDTIRAHRPHLSRSALRAQAAESLEMVGIPNPIQRLGAYPHAFSGGMRQRVLIAMAVACQPRLLIADEPTTALDVTVQARIVEVLRDLQRRLGLTILFISHNLDLVAEICSRVAVMYAGRVVDVAATSALFASPQHPYTRLLQRCIPRLQPAGADGDRFAVIEGAPPIPGQSGPGCAFAPRCPDVMRICHQETPILSPAGAGEVACWASA